MVILVLVGGLLVLASVYAVINVGWSAQLRASEDRRRQARHTGAAGSGPSIGIDWSGTQRSSLTLEVRTELAAPDAFALVESFLSQYSSGGAVERWRTFVTVSQRRSETAAVFQMRTQKKLWCTFPTLAIAGTNGAPTLVRIGGMSQFRYTQEMMLGFIPVGPRDIQGWAAYREVLERVVDAFVGSDPRCVATYTSGTTGHAALDARTNLAPLNPNHPTNGAGTLRPDRSNELPEGEHVCRRIGCSARGIPTNSERCSVCEHPTVPMSGYNAAIMSAPGVVYDPSYQPPVAPLESASAPTAALDGEAESDGTGGGGRTCIRIRCQAEGSPTEADKCSHCGFPTQPLSAYRGG